MLVALLTAALLALGSAQSTSEGVTREVSPTVLAELETPSQSPDEQSWGPLPALFDYEESEENDLQQGFNQLSSALPPCGHQPRPPQRGSHPQRPPPLPWLEDQWQRPPPGHLPGNPRGPPSFRGPQWQMRGPCPGNPQGPPPFQRHRPQGPPQ